MAVKTSWDRGVSDPWDAMQAEQDAAISRPNHMHAPEHAWNAGGRSLVDARGWLWIWDLPSRCLHVEAFLFDAHLPCAARRTYLRTRAWSGSGTATTTRRRSGSTSRACARTCAPRPRAPSSCCMVSHPWVMCCGTPLAAPCSLQHLWQLDTLMMTRPDPSSVPPSLGWILGFPGVG